VSEFEFGLILAGNAFNRWVVRAMSAAGYPDMSSLEVLVLHTVRHRGRAKKLADICLVLNIEDTHTVNYAIKKLIKAGLVQDVRQGKEKTVTATQTGQDACDRYREIRETLLVRATGELGVDPKRVSDLAALLRLMSGQYGQASRAATSY
jgi:predicted MarR family transcription regulator